MSAQPESDTPSILPMTVSSNGKLSYQYYYHDGDSSRLDLYVDGRRVQSQDVYSGMSGWQSASYTIRELGAHQVEWRVCGNGYGSSGGRVRLKLGGSSWESRAYTGTRKPWVVDYTDYVEMPPDDVGDKGWVEDESSYSVGYRSGKIDAGQTSRITARVDAVDGVTVEFKWWNSGNHAGTLNFYVNGELRSSLVGEKSEWSCMHSLSSGSDNTLVWEYVNGEEAVRGEDFGHVSSVNVRCGVEGREASVEWGTLGSDDEEPLGPEPVEYRWTTVTNFDGTATLIGVSPEPSGCVRLPSVVDGRQVKTIGQNWEVVSGLTKATRIIVPEGVSAVSTYAFCALSNLRSVVLPYTLKRLDDSAFESCFNLRYINIPISLGSLSTSPFARSGLEAVKIPEGIVVIGSRTFRNLPSLRFVSLPSTTSPMLGYTELSSYNYEWYNPFYGCARSCEFVFPAGHPSLYSENGYLLSTNGMLLAGYSRGGKAVIPEGVREVAGCAFFNDKELVSLTLPSTLRKTHDQAFGSTGLKSVTLNEGLEELGSATFSFCSALSEARLPSTLKTIAYSPFSDTGIRTLMIPASVTSLNSSSFAYLTNVTSIVFEGNRPSAMTGIVSRSGPETSTTRCRISIG